MDVKTAVYVLSTVHLVCSLIHDSPLIHISPRTLNNHSDFGFTLAYQKGQRRLVVGAPSEDVQGKVYSCDMSSPIRNTELSCDEKEIDLDKLKVTYSKDVGPNHKYFMGASISVSSDYFFTCAPLLPMDIFKDNSTDVYGTCVQYNTSANGTAHIYKSKMDQSKKSLRKPSKQQMQNFKQMFVGGTGWTTLIDEENDLLLLAKTSLLGTFCYIQKSSPLGQTKCIQNAWLGKYANLGFAVKGLKFFSNETVYAFSFMAISTQAGGIGFLLWKKKSYLEVIKTGSKLYVINDDNLGSMFGTALGAADFNDDGLDDLLVGAPAYSEEEAVECGALHIYLGGNQKSKILPNRKRTITGIKNGARFGSTIATQDIDGDGISEIIVSAPYEDVIGAVYVFSGFDIHKTLFKLDTYQIITINELKLTKRIVPKHAMMFGFSLQFVSDFDENGCNELAVGSPKTGAVDLYYCVQSVTVTMKLNSNGEATLQSDTHTMEVCAHVEYPKKPKFVIGELKITNNITGVGAYIMNPNSSINLECESCTKKKFCNNVTIHFKHTEQAEYQFWTHAQINDVSKTEFNGSEVTTNPRSMLTTSRVISRHCQGDDCQPHLSMKLEWSSSDPYVLGSSASETVTVRVTNSGNSSYESCVWVRVRGADAHALCRPHLSGYLCDLLKPLRRDEMQRIEITVNMSTPTNLQANGNLTIEAALYEKCDQLDLSRHSKDNLTIQYSLTTKQVYIEEGVSTTRQVTDKDILDDKLSLYGIQEYTILNAGSISWYNISAVISMEKKTFIASYSESSSYCNRTDTTNKVLFTCSLDLLRNTVEKLIVTQKINKTNIESHLNNYNTLKVTSELSLYFQQTGETKSKSVTSVLQFHKDKTLVNKKWLIFLIAVIVAIVLFIILTVVLYKRGFFKRQKKERLAVLRETVRRRSSKRTIGGPEGRQSQVTEEDIDKKVDGTDETDKTDADMVVSDNAVTDEDEVSAHKRHSESVSTDMPEQALHK